MIVLLGLAGLVQTYLVGGPNFLSNLAGQRSPNTGSFQHQPRISRPDKFLMYGVTSGWANQLLCHEHAIWLAHATRRTLIVSPMLGWGETMQGHWQNTSINEQYSRLKTYVPVTDVLELDWSGLNVIDWKVFYNTMGNDSALTETELSYRFNCANTKWTRNLTSWSEIQLENIWTCADHLAKRGVHNVTVRDIVTTLKPFESYDILNFNFIYPSSNFDTDHQHPKFNLTYVEPIRSTAQAIRQILWDDRPYAAIHIRGTDGPFKQIFRDDPSSVMRAALEMAGGEMEQFQKEHNHTHAKNMTLLVLSDVPAIESHNSWTSESARFSDRMATIGITMSYNFRSDYQRQVSELMENISNPYADVCVDMQLAACATAGFGYLQTTSTFLERIKDMRQQPPVC